MEHAHKLINDYIILFNTQYSISRQLSQRYRNERKIHSCVKETSFAVTIPSTTSMASNLPASWENEEYQENVEALKKLSASKNPPAQTIQGLLTTTRRERKLWMKNPEVSIKDITDTFPVLKEPRWVRK